MTVDRIEVDAYAAKSFGKNCFATNCLLIV